MANRYVRKSGSDANGGTSPSDAWLTWGKALGATGIVSGDSLYVGGGIYREIVTVAMVSPTVETFIIGDVDGAKTGDAGEVILTGYTTNDLSAPAAGTALNLNGRNFLTLRFLTLISGTSFALNMSSGHDLKLQDSTLFSATAGSPLVYTGTSGGGNVIIERCRILGAVAHGISFNPATVAGADFDLNVLVQSCLIVTGRNLSGVTLSPTGVAAGKPGGITVLNCTIIGGSNGVQAAANSSATFPTKVYYCLILANSTGLTAGTLGMLVEDYNLIAAQTARLNVNIGANSKVDFAPLFSLGQEVPIGARMRPFLTPMPSSPLLGFVPSGSSPTPPGVDLLNRPRAAGGASLNYAAGALERHDTAAKETTVVDAGAGIKLVGPADHDLIVPVDAVATVLSIKGRYDATHAATNKPQALLLANGEIGVAAQTLTMSAAADTWETLTFAPFTPTAKGYVRIRLTSRPAAGAGIAYWDTVGGAVANTLGLDHWNRGEPIPVVSGSSGGISRSRIIGGV